MNVFISVPDPGEPEPCENVFRNRILQLSGAGLQSGFYALKNVFLRQAAAQPIDRHNASGHTALCTSLFIYRIGHAAVPAFCFNPAVEDILLSAADVVFHPALVEVGDVRCTGVVKNPELHEFHPPPDAGKSGFISHNC